MLKFAPVPREENLKYKVTLGGASLINKGRYMSRYRGTNKIAIDINGKFWEKPSALKAAIAGDKKETPGRKKKAPVETGAVDNKVIFLTPKEQNSANLSTLQSEKTGDLHQLPTKKEKGFTVHKKKVRERITAFKNTRYGKYELYLWTVTFFEGMPDEKAYQALNIWLTTLRQKKMLHQYLWVAERQKNGTVHYHIAIPHQMNVQRANGFMRRTLMGYAKRNEIPFTPRQVARYNGVDIQKRKDKHGNKRITNFAEKRGNKALSNYLSKYVSKNDAEFPHLAWHNSRGYSLVLSGVTLTEREFEDINEYHLYLNPFRTLVSDWAVWAPWANAPPDKVAGHLYWVNSEIQKHFKLFHPFDRGRKTIINVRQ